MAEAVLPLAHLSQQELRMWVGRLAMVTAVLNGDLSEGMAANMLGVDRLEWRREYREILAHVKTSVDATVAQWRKDHPPTVVTP